MYRRTGRPQREPRADRRHRGAGGQRRRPPGAARRLLRPAPVALLATEPGTAESTALSPRGLPAPVTAEILYVLQARTDAEVKTPPVLLRGVVRHLREQRVEQFDDILVPRNTHLAGMIHRHGDLHAAVLARAGEPPPGATAGTQVSGQSLLADVANLTARNGRLSEHIIRLERRLSEALGGRPPGRRLASAPPPTSNRSPAGPPSWNSRSSISAPNSQRRDEDLAAARAAHRELMAQPNR
ncbi:MULTISPECIES: hypothetical protein [Streptomyces]|uniref:hypothetical protein n=1 Tax=Streptomyces TaxID=1883 RepID=UPI002248F5FF|nr:hypothetical protein [Streptomyces sp. JHD 1]MCX2970408.1 hypothetical protein [Streptomyces sp. JHD 1]